MIRRRIRRTWQPVVMAVLAISVLSGCAARKGPWGDLETGLMLEYRMPENQVLQYRVSNNVTQSLEIAGESVDIASDETYTFSVASRGMKDGSYQLEITIDTMSVAIAVPQQVLTPEVSSVIGKSFHMALSVLGEEQDLPDTESLQYDLGVGDTRSLIPSFQAIFADLAGRPVKRGDSWISEWTVSEESGGSEIAITVRVVNTVKGYETVDGLECVRIAAPFTGSFEGGGEERGSNWSTEGEIEGTSIWYFAHKEGILVRDTSQGTAAGSIFGTGPEEMTIPLTRVFEMETTLIR